MMPPYTPPPLIQSAPPPDSPPRGEERRDFSADEVEQIRNLISSQARLCGFDSEQLAMLNQCVQIQLWRQRLREIKAGQA